jgi:hypothetical protein
VLRTEKETETVRIMFLYPNGPSLPHMYTTSLGILKVPRQDTLMKVDLCSATRIYTLRAEENDKISEKHTSLHKQINVVSHY